MSASPSWLNFLQNRFCPRRQWSFQCHWVLVLVIRWALSLFSVGLDARAGSGIVRRPTIGVSEEFPRPCHVVDAVRHPRQCFERDPGRGGKVTQRVGDGRAWCRRASQRSVGTKSRRDGPRRAVAHQEMKGCPGSKAGGYASRSAFETAVPWTIAEKDPSRLAAPGSGRSMWLSHDVPSWMASVACPLEISTTNPPPLKEAAILM